MEPYMIWVWLAIFIVTLIVEACTQDLVSIWFSLGSIVCVVLSLINPIPYWVEIIAFVGVSIIALIATRPIVKKMFKNQIRATNADEFIGREVIVLSSITKDLFGEIKINDVIYNAILADGEEEIKELEHCIIVGIKGNKFIVKKSRKEV